MGRYRVNTLHPSNISQVLGIGYQEPGWYGYRYVILVPMYILVKTWQDRDTKMAARYIIFYNMYQAKNIHFKLFLAKSISFFLVYAKRNCLFPLYSYF